MAAAALDSSLSEIRACPHFQSYRVGSPKGGLHELHFATADKRAATVRRFATARCTPFVPWKSVNSHQFFASREIIRPFK